MGMVGLRAGVPAGAGVQAGPRSGIRAAAGAQAGGAAGAAAWAGEGGDGGGRHLRVVPAGDRRSLHLVAGGGEAVSALAGGGAGGRARRVAGERPVQAADQSRVRVAGERPMPAAGQRRAEAAGGSRVRVAGERPVPAAGGMAVPERRLKPVAGSAPGARKPLRLTQRGRVFVHSVVIAVVALAFAGVAAASKASPGVWATRGERSVVVHAGDTLWSIASRHVPSGDRRAAVEAIRQLNGLRGSRVEAGQELILPAR